ncbi:TonB-dependent siderophore receptor [Caulobacter sp. 17J80-11]|uniref:TonB-dependent receptor plug domain-containing protein n=1 Tax=Caulobacter sp. 17J80-11 TaxID=2763502 RepID=UPI001653A7C9|nr:TonB-dependent receptor [Caulobacter sp. 17J80-11]MBC6982770.1 TonB-dependent receptor [Caulobacter sp. 17J80-11]
MKRLLLSTATLAVLSAVTPAAAETTDAAADVDEVVVTATRLATPVELAPGARVIDEVEIERSGAVFAADLLDTVPGLSVFENGAYGGVASVRMRGASADKTLVLVDGVPQNDPSQPAGSFDFAAFDLGDVSRIEILSGPQGSLWGSDAIGGVISFTTRELDGARADLEVGSYDTVHVSAAAGRSTERWALAVNAASFTTDGISKADAADGNTERDGLVSRTAGLKGRFTVNEKVRLDAALRYARAEADIDGYPVFSLEDTPETSDSESWSGLVRAVVDGPLDFQHQLSFNRYTMDRASEGGAFPYAYSADRDLWRWTAERARPDERWAATFGVEQEDVRADLSDGSSAEQGAFSAFGVVRVKPVERLTVTGSLRRDDPETIKAVVTGRASATLDLGWGVSLQGSWGQGFKTPTISEAMCDFCSPPGPSLGLKPERAEGWDVGLAWRSADGRFDASVTGYRLAVRDQIDFFFDLSDFSFRYRNIDRTQTRGLEAEASAELFAGLTLRAAYAYTDAEDATTGERLLRVPEHQGSVGVDWTGDRARASLTVRGESEQMDADPTGTVFTPVPRDGFVVADLTGGWKLTDKVEATVRLMNLSDQRWQQTLGYGEPGRSAYVGLRLRY